ncbi:MAG: efflux transporter outer membrane subunit [Rhodobacteraceae bacterium]|nr:efflux transporter outer membrane subunit [Paracoccaceae bacterium]
MEKRTRTGPETLSLRGIPPENAINRRGFLTAGSSFVLSACSLGPEIVSPTKDLPGQFSPSAGEIPKARSNETWWRAFGDQSLNDVVEAGLAQNLEIRKAVARIRQAEGLAATVGYPYSGTVRISEGKISDDTSSGSAFASGFVRAEASWRLDLFRELEKERLAGQSNLHAAYEDANVSRLTLISEVITAYIDLRYAQELMRVTKRINETRRVTLHETRKLVADGKAPEIAEAQAQALLASSRSTMPELRVQFATSLHRIMALLGVTELPKRSDFDTRAPQPLPRSTVVRAGVPADLIRNRPDIRRAEQRLLSALATVGASEAEMYPAVVLTGNIATNLSSTGPEVNAGFLRVGFDLPIFDRPVRKGRLEAAWGVAEERRADWEQEVIFAVEEVRNALFAMEQRQNAIRQATISVEASERVLNIARREFANGTMDFLQVQDAERTFLAAENALALDRRNLAVDFVRLHVALGGSYGPVVRPA